MNRQLAKEFEEILRDTNIPPCSGLCNMSLATFLCANYTSDCIKLLFPKIYKLIKSKE